MNELTVDIAEETIQLEWSRERNELFDLVFSVLQGIFVSFGWALNPTWKNKYLNFQVTQNGQSLSPVVEDAVLRGGYKLQLPSNKELFIVVNESHGIEVWYQGKECISSAQSGESGYTDYYQKAGNWLVGVGLFLVIRTIFVVIYLQQAGYLDDRYVINIGALVNSLLFGALFVGLGIWGKHSYNKSTYWIGLGLCALRLFTGIFLDHIFTDSILGFILAAVIGLMAYYCFLAATGVPPKHRVRKKRTLENSPLDAGI